MPAAGSTSCGDALARPGSSSAVERVLVERLALGGALHLDEAAVAGHDDVHVDVGLRVLLVGEIEQRHAVDDADADGGDVVVDRDGP